MRMGKYALAAGSAILIASCAASPPVQEMSDARQAISAARGANAREYAGETISDAERLLSKAESHIRAREFASARREAVASHGKAVEARRIAEERLKDRDDN